jgi:C4-dicarboxylate-specific signal transduction histidine kinase
MQTSEGHWLPSDLYQAIVCPFCDTDGLLAGLLVGGVSLLKKAYYGEIREEMIPSFVVFSQQMSSLLHNLESQKVIRDQLKALSLKNVELREKTERLQEAKKDLETINTNLDKRLHELAGLHAIGTALTSILDTERLRDMVLTTLVHDLRYDRALIMLVDEQRNVLSDAKAVVGKAENTLFKVDVDIPISEKMDGLSRVVLSGDPVFVKSVKTNAKNPNMKILRALEAKSLLAVPLKTVDRVLGVMAVESCWTGITYPYEDEKLLTTLASQVAVSLENAKLLQRVALSERLSAIGEMAAAIAHEIRNPLSSIGTLVDLLGTRQRGKDTFLFTGIKEELTRLQDIITKFLN